MFTRTKEIRIETSTICNYNCRMCARKSFARKKQVMGNDLFDTLVEKTRTELSHIEIVTLSGFGEFSLDPAWKYKVAAGSKNFQKVHIVTNAAMLSQSDFYFLLDHAADIRISLYALDEETYRNIHNPPAHVQFTVIQKNIEYAMRVKKKDQRIILNYLEIAANEHATKDWINYWKKRVDLIEVWQPHNWINAQRYRSLDKQRLTTCGRPFNGPIQVQVDGTVNVCCFDYNGEMLIGDLRTQSFHEIFHGREMEHVQACHQSGRADHLPLCAQCDQRNQDESKARHMIYNSKYDRMKRITTTSTEYDKLVSKQGER